MGDIALRVFLWIDIITVIIGIICDIGVEITGIYTFTATESFVDYIFSAIVTVSVLSITLISLIANSLKDTYYGFELKEILRFKKSPINLNMFSVATLGNILVAAGLLAAFDKHNTVNTLLAVLIATIVMIMVMSRNINEIISKDIFCREKVEEYIASIGKQRLYNKENFMQDLNNLFRGWNAAIEKKNPEERAEVVNLIIELLNAYKAKEEKQYQITTIVNSKLSKIIEESSFTFGYQVAVQDVVRIYGSFTDSHHDMSNIICKPLEKLMGYGDSKISEIDYLQDITELYFVDLYKEKRVSESLIAMMYYRYFKAIKENVVCSPRLRSQLIKQFIKKMTRDCSDDKEKKLTNEQKVLLGILKRDIIQNENPNEREQLYKLILQNIIEYTYYGQKNYGFNNYISMVGQILFNYCLMESEVLTQAYRNELKKLAKSQFDSPNIASISITSCLLLNIENVLIAFAKRLQESNDDDYRSYDYFPGYICVKTAVWGFKNDVLYFMLLYVLFYDEIMPLNDDLYFEWGKMDSKLKNEITRSFSNFFDVPQKCFKEYFVELLYEFSKMMGYEDREKIDMLINNHQESVFNSINELRKDTVINYSKTVKVPSTDEDIINQQLSEFLEEENIFGWDSEFKDGKVFEFTMTPVYGRRENRVDREIARSIKEAAVYGINWYIVNRTKRLCLSHDLEGVEAFYRYLQRNKLMYRNFDFLNDYRIKRLNMSESYLEDVSQVCNQIKLEKTKGIRFPMFFKKDKFKFNIEVIDYEPKNLTDEEAVWYMGDKGDYNGLYNVEGALMPKEQAVEVIKKNICVERTKIKLILAMERKDVVHIEFKD